MQNWRNNLVQIINEVVVLVCVWTMFLFSLYVPSAEIRYELAYFFLYLIAADMVLNVFYLVITVLEKVYGACRSCIARCRAKKNRLMNVRNL